MQFTIHIRMFISTIYPHCDVYIYTHKCIPTDVHGHQSDLATASLEHLEQDHAQRSGYI